MLSSLKNRYKKWRNENLLYQPFAWKYWINHPYWMQYEKTELDSFQLKLLKELKSNGIVIFNYADLLDAKLFEELHSFYEQYQQTHQGMLEAQRQKAGEVATEKTFLHTLRAEFNPIAPEHILVRVALQKRLIQVVEAYLELPSRFRYFDLWHTFISKSGPMRSQLWHKDPEDYRMLKFFIYLNDVDLDAGPFIYAPGTHADGAIKQQPEWFREENRKAQRSTDEQMAQVVPSQHWITAKGPKGTAILADTRGYHKGGFATGNERIMYNCMFNSPGSYFEPTFQLKHPLTDPYLQARIDS